MSKPLSIKAGNEEIEIQANKSDHLAALVRGILGAAPILGPMVTEVLTTQIPNQKLERIITFMKVLEDRLRYMEEDTLKQEFKSEEFADLLEDSLPQASRALSQERMEYIANLLKNSMTDEKLDHLAKKKLLTMLNELNDAEVIILYYYSLKEPGQRESMRIRYPFVPQTLPSPEDKDCTNDDELVYESYRSQIMNYVRFPSPDYETTNRANLLLRYIGLTPGVYTE